MATYYVSATTGNDSNAGTAVGTAVATIGAAENKATTAGDIVYIAPGTYRETVTHGYSGTAANRIYFIGDPDCEIFGNTVEPGIVRITVSDSDNKGTDTVYTVNSNGKDYITWKNVYLDGTTSGITSGTDVNTTYGFRCSVESDNMEVINCMAQHYVYAAYRVGYMYDSVFIGAFAGTYQGYLADRCIAIGGYTNFYYTNLVRNCVGAGGLYCFLYNDKVVNCTQLGGQTGFRPYNADVVYDSVAIGSYYGFFGGFNTTSTQNGTVSGSLSVANRYTTYYGKMHGIKIASTQYPWMSGRDPLIGKNGSTDMQGDGITWDLVAQPLYSIDNMKKLADVVKPTISSEAYRGVTSTETDSDAGDLDIEGNPRKMGSQLGMYMEGGDDNITSSRDIGAHELAVVEVTGSVSSSLPGFKITDEGMFRIPITVSASSAVTASVGVLFDKGGVHASLSQTQQPQLQLRYSETYASASTQFITGSNLIIQSTTKGTTSDGSATMNTFSTIAVSGSFDKQRELELVFVNQMTGSTSRAVFSDLEIT